jgi:hypothetical protein
MVLCLVCPELGTGLCREVLKFTELNSKTAISQEDSAPAL